MSRAPRFGPAHETWSRQPTRRSSRHQTTVASQSSVTSPPTAPVRLAPPLADTHSQYETLETATLPSGKYRVLLPLKTGCEADAAMRAAALVSGEEILHDAQRRGEAEGVLDGARGVGERGNKRRRFASRDAAVRVEVGEPLWSTALLRYPCTYGIKLYPHVMRPSRAPPAAGMLLPHTLNADDFALTAEIELIPWGAAAGPGDMGHLEEEPPPFEHLWREKCGFWSNTADRPVIVVASSDGTSAVEEATTEEAAAKVEVGSETGASKPLSWSEDSKRRKRDWCRRIERDGQYGSYERCIGPPHALTATWIATQTDTPADRIRHRPPAYVLPRALSTSTHPFHPDLASYLAHRPLARLYWLIPLHGPVLIDGIATAPTSESTPHPLAPSFALLGPDHPYYPPTTRPFPLLWTSQSVRVLWCLLSTLVADASGPFGRLSARLSGPKPDPFIDLPEPAPVRRHAGVGGGGGGGCGPCDGARIPPVRVSAGDHLRLYVDARHALELRSWLHAVVLPKDDSEVGAVSGRSSPAFGPGKTGPRTATSTPHRSSSTQLASDADVVDEGAVSAGLAAESGPATLTLGKTKTKTLSRRALVRSREARSSPLEAGRMRGSSSGVQSASASARELGSGTVTPRPAQGPRPAGHGASSDPSERSVGVGAPGGGGGGGGGVRVFNKVRLALVGEKGEVLVVA